MGGGEDKMQAVGARRNSVERDPFSVEQNPSSVQRHAAAKLFCFENFPALRMSVRLFAAFALIWSVGSSLWVYPHSLSYFNESIGGPLNGPEHLLGSNVDWGQDLRYLKWWLEEHPEARPVYLAYFGYIYPEDVGINYTLPAIDGAFGENKSIVPLGLLPGWYAVSENYLRGYPWHAPNGQRRGQSIPKEGLLYFQNMKTKKITGSSIHIFHVSGVNSDVPDNKK
jgi:hypothetical protein